MDRVRYGQACKVVVKRHFYPVLVSLDVVRCVEGEDLSQHVAVVLGRVCRSASFVGSVLVWVLVFGSAAGVEVVFVRASCALPIFGDGYVQVPVLDFVEASA